MNKVEMQVASEQSRWKCQNSGISCMAAKLMNKVHQELHTYGVIGFQAAISRFEEINWNCSYVCMYAVNITVAKATTFINIISCRSIFKSMPEKYVDVYQCGWMIQSAVIKSLLNS